MDRTKEYEKLNKKAECVTHKLSEAQDKNLKEEKVILKELKIDPELRDLLPPLSQGDFKLLEKGILEKGCLDSIKTWKGYIVDGHNRYNICKKYNIGFQVIELAFDSKDDVIQWMVETQLGRRNLSPLQRVEIAEKYRPVYERQAKENQLSGLKQNSSVLPKSAEPIKPVNTRDALAKVAKIGHDSYNKAKKIIDLEKDANEGKVELTDKQKEIIEKAKKDDIKVNTAFNELFGKSKEEKKPKIEEKEFVEPKIETPSKKEKDEGIPTDNIKNIIKDMKTPKFVELSLDFLNEIDCFQDNVSDFLDIVNETLFERYNISYITKDEKSIAISYCDDLILKINDLKNKINLLNIKENE